MQTSQFMFKKSIWLMPLSIAVFLLLSISSCKGKKETFAGMDVSCVVLLQSKMKAAWQTPGYFKSVDYFTFYSGYNRMTRKFNVVVQAFKKDNSSVGGYVELTQGDECSVTLPNGVAIGDNIIELADLGILKEDGTLKDFDYIKFTPRVCPEGDINFMCFDLEVVTGGVGIPIARGTLPCPPCPYCKPPCAAEINKAKIDTLMNAKDTTGQKVK